MVGSDLRQIDPRMHERRERVFLVLAGLFIGTLAMLNILGISRFIVFGSYGSQTGWQWGQWGDRGSNRTPNASASAPDRAVGASAPDSLPQASDAAAPGNPHRPARHAHTVAVRTACRAVRHSNLAACRARRTCGKLCFPCACIGWCD